MNINPLYFPFFFLLFLSKNGYCSLDVSCQPEDCSTSADITAVQYHSEASGSFLEGYLEIYSTLYAKVGDTYTILLKGLTRYGSGRITYQNISSDLNSGNYSIVSSVPAETSYICAGMFSPNNPAACDDEDNYTPNPPEPEDCNTISDQGDKTRCVIKENYTNSSGRCDDNDKKPGFMCSGRVIRGTDSDLNRNYYSWNPSPTSVTSGGVSFSFLRKDSKFQKLAYGYVSGFIFYPELLTPDGKDNTIKVLCGYPLDAATDVRDNKGGGQYTDIIMSEPCIQQSIKTADQWYNENYLNANNKYEYCSLTLYSDSEQINTNQQFDAMISAQKLLGNISFNEQNELRLETWEQNKTDIPLEAFFYITGSNVGLKSSQKDQQDFSDVYGQFVPIIQISLPASQQADAQFYYNAGDQVIQS